MPKAERDRILAQIAEVRRTLTHTQSEDVPLTLLQALRDCD
jgi:hypothetical protein